MDSFHLGNIRWREDFHPGTKDKYFKSALRLLQRKEYFYENKFC